MNDAYYMRKAIALAERGRGTTSPNPLVGALIVDGDGVIVGRGSHRAAGGPHAEVVALEDAGARAQGATLYCTLEPCCHVGRTGPCAPLVTRAGIRRAVIALEDPNPLVNGGGLRHLRDNGVGITVGVERDRADRQNAAFLTNIRFDRPFIILKVALSADGMIAAAPGRRTAITGPAANRRIHRQRAEVDAIGVGSGTVLADDPLLTARGAYRARPLTRVIFDRRLRTPAAARVLSTRNAGPVIIISTEEACASNPGGAAALRAVGADVWRLPDGDILSGLRALKQAGITSLVLEGGSTLHAAALQADVVDVVNVYIAAKVLGAQGVNWAAHCRLAMDELADRRAIWLGDEVLVEGYVHRNH